MKRLYVIVSLILIWTPSLVPAQPAETGTAPVIQMPDIKPEGLTLRDTLSERVQSARSTIADQTDVAVTVYNNNLGLVRERRSVKLLPGETTLQFMDVPSSIRPETVSLTSVSAPGRLHILEQNYEFDLMSPEKLMEKYVGREVRLINKDNDLSFAEVTARLVSMNNGPIYEIDGDFYLGHPGSVVLPEIPETLIAKPTLAWLLQNEGTDHEVEVTYLTEGITWKADYVLTLNAESTKMSVEGWVTLTNQSGAPYNNALLKLVAGEVHRVYDEMPQVEALGYAARMAPAAPPMREEAFAEYHLYTLERRTSIKENQSKQVSLLTAEDAAVHKAYEFRGAQYFYSQQVPEMPPQHVAVFLVFRNDEASRLGMPLPAGVMRVYQKDSDGAQQFVGEDRIEHTPKDEEVRLQIGEAFDVVGERKQTDYRQLLNNIHESAYSIVLRNHKEEEITVDVVEPFQGDWQILESSHEFVKRDARSAVCSVAIPKDGEVTITYRVRVKY